MNTMPRCLSVALATSFLCWVQATSRSCDCGRDPTQNGLTYSMSFDVASPDPQVVAVRPKGKTNTVWVSYETGRDAAALRFAKSSNGGRTWALDPSFQYLGQHNLVNPNVLYRTNLQRFERSTDGGQSWRRPRLWIDGNSEEEIVKQNGGGQVQLFCYIVAIDPRDASRIYAEFDTGIPASNPYGVVNAHDFPGVYVSKDGGTNWTLFSSKLLGPSAYGPSPLGISTSNRDVMVGIAREGLVVTKDGGRTWGPVGQQEQLEEPARTNSPPPARAGAISGDKSAAPEWAKLHVSQIDFQPGEQDTVFISTNKGLYRSLDGTHTWRLMDTGTTHINEVGGFFFDPSDPRQIYVGAAWKVLLSQDSGCHFRTFLDWRHGGPIG